jgi:hypothetical protein
MKNHLLQAFPKKYIQFKIINFKCHQLFGIVAILFTLLSGCSRVGIYSIIVTNPLVQCKKNSFNDLGEPYRDKKIVFPNYITEMTPETRNSWVDTLNQYKVNSFDTTYKINTLKIPGLLIVEIPACAQKGVAIIMLTEVDHKGKNIQVKGNYVCRQDNPNVDWSAPGKIWAATPNYKIDIGDANNNCYIGFHSVEFQFTPEKKNPLLRGSFAVCADGLLE